MGGCEPSGWTSLPTDPNRGEQKQTKGVAYPRAGPYFQPIRLVANRSKQRVLQAPATISTPRPPTAGASACAGAQVQLTANRRIALSAPLRLRYPLRIERSGDLARARPASRPWSPRRQARPAGGSRTVRR